MEDDLYSDLDGANGIPTPAKPKSAETLRLEQQIKELESKLKSMEQENETLKRNMGTLFRTAKSEINRKDAEISSLMKQIDEQEFRLRK